jgi:hypothetical protein
MVMVGAFVAATAQPGLATVMVATGSATAWPWASVQIPITIQNTPAGGVKGVQLDVLFPQAQLSADATAACVAASNLPGTTALRQQLEGPGWLRVSVFDSGTAHFGDGTLVTCTFTVAGDASPGLYSLAGSGLVVSDPSGYALPSTFTPGGVTVPCPSGCCP